jgi:hypothetical protein
LVVVLFVVVVEGFLVDFWGGVVVVVVVGLGVVVDGRLIDDDCILKFNWLLCNNNKYNTKWHQLSFRGAAHTFNHDE